MVVYIVHGMTGEYEDSREWIAGVLLTEEEAKHFHWVCQNDADYMMEKVTKDYYRYYDEEYKGHDPEFQIDYTGTRYEISRHIVREGV